MNHYNHTQNASKEYYSKQWNYVQSAWAKGQMPQSMLFVGPLDSVFFDFINQLTQLVLCNKKQSKPCLECPDCQMAVHEEHPDVTWIKPEKSGGPIKIDQIRELQSYSYLTPQRAKHRLIVIESADRMNSAAANSLLKILEEPAQHTLFLLIAQQLSTVLPTVLSRCQIIRFPSLEDLSVINLLSRVEHYPEDSEKARIVKQSEFLLDRLIAVIEHQEHPCIVAAQWTQFEFSALLWFFYLIYSQVQMMQINASVPTGIAINQLINLASLLNPITIFAQIDKINILQRKLNHNMNVNQTLALEDLLFALHADSSFSLNERKE